VVRNADARGSGRLPSTGAIIARLAYAHARAAGIALEPLAAKAGLSCRQIEDPRLRLSVRDQIRFLNAAADILQDDLLGFHLAQRVDLREIGFLYYVVASSSTLTEALQRAARYSSLANEGIDLRFVDRGDVGISFRYLGVSRHFDRHQIEFVVTTLFRTCAQLTGLRLAPSRVRLTHSREDGHGELTEFFGHEVEFGSTIDEIMFAADVRHQSAVSADPYLNGMLIRYCEQALAHRPRGGGSFRLRVENAVVPLLPHGKARAGDIAQRLGLSQRTFARRLSAEGLTFSELLEQLRSDLAKRYLGENELPISQIAWLLGYREIGAFSHAFKRWTGKTPRELRAGLGA
jgi:AraC-like DNA-binding protein